MPTWFEAKKRIIDRNSPTMSWTMCRQDILRVFEFGEAAGVSPENACLARFTSLMAALPELKRSVRQEDPKLLGEILYKAAHFGAAEVKMELHVHDLRKATVMVGKENVAVIINKEQLERLQRLTKTQLKFVGTKEVKPKEQEEPEAFLSPMGMSHL